MRTRERMRSATGVTENRERSQSQVIGQVGDVRGPIEQLSPSLEVGAAEPRAVGADEPNLGPSCSTGQQAPGQA